jgi:hypothetical protein
MGTIEFVTIYQIHVYAYIGLVLPYVMMFPKTKMKPRWACGNGHVRVRNLVVWLFPLDQYLCKSIVYYENVTRN